MKKVLLASASILLGTSAFSADLPQRQPTYSQSYAAPATNWSGCYLGIQGGYARATSDGVPGHIDGGLGGGQVGCNWQTTPNWVWGVESDLLYSGIKDGDPAVVQLKADWLGSVRLRTGIATSNAFLYATGGVGFGHAQVTVGGLEDSNIHTGWVAGGGIEWMMGANWTAKVEYLHYDFGKETYFTVPVDYNVDAVKVGLNYKY
jgi:outer membrane immunogenic protein